MKTRSLIGFVTVLIVVGVLAGAFYYNWSLTPTSSLSPPPPASPKTPSPTSSPSATPFHSPNPTPSKTTFTCNVYFTPNGQVESYLIETINSAQKSVYAAFYDLDLVNVAEALVEARLERGATLES